jgi:alkanesulfonate monooxygenase SsuD/methylene tetrahydromethanopterin reductase-like flavin-dependent oxidoreductase (luciferase family)
MEFGLFMMPLHPPHRPLAEGYARDVDQIVLADRLGFREADLLLAQALVLKKTIKLGTGVTLLALHNPVYLAHHPLKDRGYYLKPYQQRGFIPMSSSLLSRTYLADHWKLVEAGAATTGRPVDRSRGRIARDIMVGPTPAIARDRARAALGRNCVQHQRSTI